MSLNIAIAVFVYQRPAFTISLLKFLEYDPIARKTPLYVFSDGPKPGDAEQVLECVAQVKRIAKNYTLRNGWDFQDSPNNRGLATSIISGITKVLKQHDAVIVLEDDLELSDYFFKYMFDALEVYKKELKVLSIGSCNFFAHREDLPDTFFSPIPDCWGWGVWKDRWESFEPDGRKLFRKLSRKKLVHSFNVEGYYDYYSMLELQKEGKMDSWAIRWQALAYLTNRLCLYPKFPVSKNSGIDAAATNGIGIKMNELCVFPTAPIEVHYQPVEICEIAFEEMKATFDNLFAARVLTDDLNNTPKNYIRRLANRLGVLGWYRRLRKTNDLPDPSVYPWVGNFSSWTKAQKKAGDYGKPEILEKVLEASLAVKSGRFPFERDSVLLDKPEPPLALIECLLKIANDFDGDLHIVDFGGSLGSSYFQTRSYLSELKSLKWSVVEQSHFVEAGKNFIANEELDFYTSLNEVSSNYHVILFSGVLQYLSEPYAFLREQVLKKSKFIIVDRTAFISESPSRITIQRVSPQIYDASYPSWFFKESEFLNLFLNNYNILSEFNSFADPERTSEDGKRMYWKGYLFKLK